MGVKLPGQITAQPIVVRGAPGTHRATVYFATSAGVVAAFSDTGRQLWRVQVGKLAHVCKQLPGYGVTGTPVADPATHSLYFADGVGRLHALDLETGKERAGWPVRLYTDFRQELVWGALTAIRGSIYLGTGSYCDAPMVGKIFRVNTRTRDVSHWDVVPQERGGGGGVWGWGGIAYSSARQSLLAVTGNAFRGGSNDGDSFREWEPYGEHLVELSLSLQLRAASHPAGLTAPNDLDFVGSPVVVTRPGCPEQVIALEQERAALRVEDEDDRGRARVDAAARSLEPARYSSPRPRTRLTCARSSSTRRRGWSRSRIGPACSGKIAWRKQARRNPVDADGGRVDRVAGRLAFGRRADRHRRPQRPCPRAPCAREGPVLHRPRHPRREDVSGLVRRPRARATVTRSADVAQLVEHFTRNEGVRGSSPRVGSGDFGCRLRALVARSTVIYRADVTRPFPAQCVGRPESPTDRLPVLLRFCRSLRSSETCPHPSQHVRHA